MPSKASEELVNAQTYEDISNIEEIQHGQWKRIMLLVIAITVHNIPEGLAVGVGFGAIGSSSSATFESARLVQSFEFGPWRSLHIWHPFRHVFNCWFRQIWVQKDIMP